MKVTLLPIEYALPAFAAPPFTCCTSKLAAPDTLISPALAADTATREPANAVSPIFLMFILITPYL